MEYLSEMDGDMDALARGVIFLIAILGAGLLRWCSRTEQELVEHLRGQLREESGVDAAYSCTPTGDGKILEGVKKF